MQSYLLLLSAIISQTTMRLFLLLSHSFPRFLNNSGVFLSKKAVSSSLTFSFSFPIPRPVQQKIYTVVQKKKEEKGEGLNLTGE